MVLGVNFVSFWAASEAFDDKSAMARRLITVMPKCAVESSGAGRAVFCDVPRYP